MKMWCQMQCGERFIEEFPDKDGDYEAFSQYMYDNKDEVYELLEDWSE